MVDEHKAKALIHRSKRGFSLNGDLVYQIQKWMSNGRLCINPKKVLQLAEELINTILAPVVALVEMALQPLVDEIKKHLPCKLTVA